MGRGKDGIKAGTCYTELRNDECETYIREGASNRL
jgi:hypothetical protein